MVVCHALSLPFFFFFNDTATTEIYTLSLHDALPISVQVRGVGARAVRGVGQDVGSRVGAAGGARGRERGRSEEHTSELQSRLHLVCRLLLEKKNNRKARVVSAKRHYCYVGHRTPVNS